MMREHLTKLGAAALAACVAVWLAGCSCSKDAEDSWYDTNPDYAEDYVEDVFDADAEALAEALAEVLGEWYAETGGMVASLTLDRGGTYTLTFGAEDPMTGTWTYDAGQLHLDSETSVPLLLLDGNLVWTQRGLVFVREFIEAWAPGEVRTDAALEEFQGYWTAQMALDGGVYKTAKAAGDNTDIYVEDVRVALGGALFGDIIRDAEFAGGALTYGEDDWTVALALADDGWMRMTYAKGGEERVVFLVPSALDFGE